MVSDCIFLKSSNSVTIELKSAFLFGIDSLGVLYVPGLSFLTLVSLLTEAVVFHYKVSFGPLLERYGPCLLRWLLLSMILLTATLSSS